VVWASLANAFGYRADGNRWNDPNNPFGPQANVRGQGQGMTTLEKAFLGTQIVGTGFGIYADIKRANAAPKRKRNAGNKRGPADVYSGA